MSDHESETDRSEINRRSATNRWRDIDADELRKMGDRVNRLSEALRQRAVRLELYRPGVTVHIDGGMKIDRAIAILEDFIEKVDEGVLRQYGLTPLPPRN